MLDPAGWNSNDGFSTVGPVLFAMQQRPLLADLTPHTDIGRSTDPSRSTTTLIDEQTGELLPHWVEEDAFHTEFGGDAAAGRPPLLILQPAVPLRFNASYVVAVRGLRAAATGGAGGAPMAAVGPFAALLAGETVWDEGWTAARTQEYNRCPRHCPRHCPRAAPVPPARPDLPYPMGHRPLQSPTNNKHD